VLLHDLFLTFFDLNKTNRPHTKAMKILQIRREYPARSWITKPSENFFMTKTSDIVPQTKGIPSLSHTNWKKK
jgi:hypothetical protein